MPKKTLMIIVRPDPKLNKKEVDGYLKNLFSYFGVIQSLYCTYEVRRPFYKTYRLSYSSRLSAEKAQAGLDGTVHESLGIIDVVLFDLYQKSQRSRLVFTNLPLKFDEEDIFKLHSCFGRYVHSIRFEKSIGKNGEPSYYSASVTYIREGYASNILAILKAMENKTWEVYQDVNMNAESIYDNGLVKLIVSDNITNSLLSLKNYENIEGVRKTNDWNLVKETILEILLKDYLAKNEAMDGKKQKLFDDISSLDNDKIFTFLRTKTKKPLRKPAEVKEYSMKNDSHTKAIPPKLVPKEVKFNPNKACPLSFY